MLDYETFNAIFNEKIFAKSKPDLLKKVADYPDRYVGLFRSSTPEAKLLQNVLQSNEIRFGDAFEEVIKQYFIASGWQALPRRVTSKEGDSLDIDQLLHKDGEVLFIEQKVRDDHDSSKKRGQINNFEKKIETLVGLYGKALTRGFFYFIDPSLIKNKNFYDTELATLQESWHIELSVSYGQDMFTKLGYPNVWLDILQNLERWRQHIPNLPTVNFDANPLESAREIQELPLRTFRKLFQDERIVKDILPVIFPTSETLRLLVPQFRQQGLPIGDTIAEYIQQYSESRVPVIQVQVTQ